MVAFDGFSAILKSNRYINPKQEGLKKMLKHSIYIVIMIHILKVEEYNNIVPGKQLHIMKQKANKSMENQLNSRTLYGHHKTQLMHLMVHQLQM